MLIKKRLFLSLVALGLVAIGAETNWPGGLGLHNLSKGIA